jgi:hypothetical protein
MDDLPESLNRLAARVEALERRIAALEHPSQLPSAAAAMESIQAHAVDTQSVAVPGGAFSVLGTAMLGIAGAYLLRAIAESTSLPKLGLAAIAILYAVFWLVWATHAPAGAWLASTTYACTSALILAPMLWELTLRFDVLPAEVTAAVLAAFVCAATALAWKRNLVSVVWVANVAAAMVAVALSIATHKLTPFIAALLLMSILCEYASIRRHGLGVRMLVAAAADVSIWVLIFIYSSAQNTRTDYPLLGMAALLAPGLALFTVYGVSVAIKTAFLERQITVFETMQITIAFLLAASSLLYFGQQSSTTILGIICLILSGVSYATVFAVLDRAPERRNYHVFLTWSAALLLSGCLLCLPSSWAAASLAVSAVAATILGVRLNRLSLQFHGVVYLLAAAAISGLLNYAFLAMAGALPAAPSMSICVVSACAILCYVAGRFGQGEAWSQQLLHIVFAVVAIAAAAALLVQGQMALIAMNVNPGAHHLAFIRTLTICLAALGLAFAGAHWRRRELTRIGYATLVLIAAKLVFEDLRHGHLEFIAASIFLFAVTLIAVPRIARMGHGGHKAEPISAP